MAEFFDVLSGEEDYGIVPIVIDAITIPDDYPRSELGDLEGLAESIRRSGMLAPIVVDPEMNLKYGLRRLLACRDVLKWRKINALITDRLDEPHQAWIAFRDENACRKPLAPSEALVVAERIEKILAPIADKRKKAAQFKTKENSAPVVHEKTSAAVVPANLPEPLILPKGKEAREAAAAAVGHSASTLRTVKKVVQAAHDGNLAPKVREKVQAQLQIMDETGNVNRAWQTVKELTTEPKEIDEKEVAQRKLKTATASLSKALAFTQEALDLGDLEPAEFDAELDDIERAAQQALDLVHQMRRARFKVVG